MRKSSVIAGGIFILFAIVLGAFGAHALKKFLTVEQLVSFETGVRYQMYHGIGLLILGLAADKFSFKLTVTSRLLVWGTVLFSGSIYVFTIQHMVNVNRLADGLDPISWSFMGPVTPIGGMLLIAGWLAFLISLLNVKQRE